MMNDISGGISMWAQVSFVLSECTRSTDRQTDGRTERPWNAVRCIACIRTVKTHCILWSVSIF